MKVYVGAAAIVVLMLLTYMFVGGEEPREQSELVEPAPKPSVDLSKKSVSTKNIDDKNRVSAPEAKSKRITYQNALKLRLQQEDAMEASREAEREKAQEEQRQSDEAHQLWRENKHAEALEKFRFLAERGNKEAMTKVGNAYHFGEGTEIDYGMAFDWYEQAFIAGDKRAPQHLGRMYYNGEGIDKNVEEAFQWYKHSAMRGHIGGMHWMGGYYRLGQGSIGQDKLRAVAWYRLAKQQDKNGSMEFYYKDMPAVSGDEEEGVQLIIREIEEEMKDYQDY